MKGTTSCGYVLADGVCPVCFTQRGQHIRGCPRAATDDEIRAIIERLPDVSQRPTPARDSVGEVKQ
jgi:hypothetical protein